MRYIKQYLDIVKITKSENTYKTYQNALHLWFPNNKVNLQLDYISSILNNWKDISDNTIALRCQILKKFIDYLRERGKNQDYQMVIKLLNQFKTKETVPEVVTVEQYKEILKYTDLRTEIIIDLMYQNGLRVSEVANILTKNYDYENSNIVLLDTKNGNDYKIILTTELNDKIHNLLSTENIKSEYLLHTSSGNKLIDSYIRRLVKNVCIKAGFSNLHCHSFRHGSAVLLLNSNVNLFTIKEHLRHKTIGSTQRYLHITDKQRNEIANIFSSI